MLRKSSYSLKIALFLSTVILFPLDQVYPMDAPLKGGERIVIKQEPSFEMSKPRKELKRLMPIERLREIIKKINPTGNRENCLECAIRCYNLIKNQLQTAERVGPSKEVDQNMICEDLFATFKRKEDNAKVDSKTVRLNLEDGSTEPVDVTFDAIVFEEEGSYQTLERYLDGIPLKSTSCVSSFDFRVGFLYLIHKGSDDTGHMINFYCRNSEKDKYYIIDAQCGSIKTLENFLNEESGKYLNYLYIYYDKGENLPPIEASKNYIQIKDEDLREGEMTNPEGDIESGVPNSKERNKRFLENQQSSDQPFKKQKTIATDVGTEFEIFTSSHSEMPIMPPEIEMPLVPLEAEILPDEVVAAEVAELVEQPILSIVSTKRQRKKHQTSSDQGSKSGPKRRKKNIEVAPSEGATESEVSIKKPRKKNSKPKDQGSKGQEKKSPKAPTKSKELAEKSLEERIQFPKEVYQNQNIDASPIFNLLFKDKEAQNKECEILAALIYLGCDWIRGPIEQMALQEKVPSIGKKTLDLVKKFRNVQEAKEHLYLSAGFSMNPNLNKIASSAICTAAVLGDSPWAKDVILKLLKCDYLISPRILLVALNNYSKQKTDLIQKNAQWIKDIFWNESKSDSDNQKVIESMTVSCAEAEEDEESLNIILEMAKCHSIDTKDTRAMTLWLEATILEMPKWGSKYLCPNIIFAGLNKYKKLKNDIGDNHSQWIWSIIGVTSKSDHEIVRNKGAKALSLAIARDFSWAKDQVLLMAKSDSVNIRDTAVRTLNIAVMEGSLWAKDLILQMLKMDCFYSKLAASRALAELLEWKEKKTVETLGNMSSIEISSIWSRDNILKMAENHDFELKEGASCALFLALKAETQWARDIIWDLAKNDSNNSRDTVAMALSRGVNGGDPWAKDTILKMIQTDSYFVQLTASRTLAELLRNDSERENYSKWASEIIKAWGNFDSTKLSSMTYGWVVAKDYHKARHIIYSLVSDRDKMWLASVDTGWVAAVGDQRARDQIVEAAKGGNAKDREWASQALGRAISIDCPWAQGNFSEIFGSGDTKLKTFATLALGEAIRRNSQWAIKKGVELGIEINENLGPVVSALSIAVEQPRVVEQLSILDKVPLEKMHSAIETVVKFREPMKDPLKQISQSSARSMPQIVRGGTTPPPTMLNNQRGYQMPAIPQQPNTYFMNQGTPQGMNLMTKVTPQVIPRVVPRVVPQGSPQIIPQNNARLTPQIVRVGSTPPPTTLNTQMGYQMPAIPQQANNFLINQGVPQNMGLIQQQQERRIRELQEEIARLSGNREGK